MPVTPKSAPTTQVQITLLDASAASATTAAPTQQIVPSTTTVTTDLIDDFSAEDMEEA